LGKKTLLISSLLFVLTFALFEVADWDIIIQDHFYDFKNHQWIYQDPDGIYYLIFYKLIKLPIVAIAIFALYKIIKAKISKLNFIAYRSYLIVILTLILFPTAIALIGKPLTNVQCPDDSYRYGGGIPHVKILEKYPINKNSKDGKWKPGRCYPAGHASGGFALLSLYFVADTKRKKWIYTGFALTMGIVMSVFQMVRGLHFLSHQVATVLLSLILISTLNLLLKKE
jgi:membrane-associated PAP2 superfamily phosphatase